MKKTFYFLFSSRTLIVFSLMFYGSVILRSNNLNIGTVTKSNDTLIFTVAWDNSWRVSTGPSNWDAVWLYVKGQDCNNNRLWSHAKLNPVGSV
jgi:hypothetical protein